MSNEHHVSPKGTAPSTVQSHTSNARQAGRISSGIATVSMLLAAVAGGLLVWGYDKQQAHNAGIRAEGRGAGGGASNTGGAPWSDEESPIPVSSEDPMWGNRDAPVSIVIFSDFQCPFCSRVGASIEEVRTAYGPAKVRVIWKNEPLSFHPNAKPAAEAAQGVMAMNGSDAFWKFHETAFKNQKSLTSENFVAWAQAAGVRDLASYKAGLLSHQWAAKVDRDHAVAKAAGISAVPASLINGVMLSGAQPFDAFKKVIDAELEKAHAKLQSGVAKDHVYIELTKENRKNVKPGAGEGDADEEAEDTKTVFKIPVGESPILGSNQALVTIVEFSDFQCPFCKRVEPALGEVREKYGDKVRIVWKHTPLPFHPRAIPASNLTLEARAQKGTAGFWAAHDKLFEMQPKLEDADLEAAAKDLGLNLERAKAAMKTNKYKAEIDADSKLAKDFSAEATPSFFINGRRLVGAQPFEKFKAIIDEEVLKAEGLLKQGIAPARLYEVLTKDGKSPRS
jgi:protein-disulfide isomerase